MWLKRKRGVFLENRDYLTADISLQKVSAGICAISALEPGANYLRKRSQWSGYQRYPIPHRFFTVEFIRVTLINRFFVLWLHVSLLYLVLNIPLNASASPSRPTPGSNSPYRLRVPGPAPRPVLRPGLKSFLEFGW
jgi:hypothetical protein